MRRPKPTPYVSDGTPTDNEFRCMECGAIEHEDDAVEVSICRLSLWLWARNQVERLQLLKTPDVTICAACDAKLPPTPKLPERGLRYTVKRAGRVIRCMVCDRLNIGGSFITIRRTWLWQNMGLRTQRETRGTHVWVCDWCEKYNVLPKGAVNPH